MTFETSSTPHSITNYGLLHDENDNYQTSFNLKQNNTKCKRKQKSLLLYIGIKSDKFSCMKTKSRRIKVNCTTETATHTWEKPDVVHQGNRISKQIWLPYCLHSSCRTKPMTRYYPLVDDTEKHINKIVMTTSEDQPRPWRVFRHTGLQNTATHGEKLLNSNINFGIVHQYLYSMATRH